MNLFLSLLLIFSTTSAFAFDVESDTFEHRHELEGSFLVRISSKPSGQGVRVANLSGYNINQTGFSFVFFHIFPIPSRIQYSYQLGPRWQATASFLTSLRENNSVGLAPGLVFNLPYGERKNRLSQAFFIGLKAGPLFSATKDSDGNRFSYVGLVDLGDRIPLFTERLTYKPTVSLGSAGGKFYWSLELVNLSLFI